MIASLRAVALGAALAFTTACASATYGVLEQFGVEKRDILVDRVDDARDAQEDASEEFQNALEAFRAVVDVDGGDLEKLYDRPMANTPPRSQPPSGSATASAM